jgi:two-component system sensor histidine kinase MprB
VTYLATPPPPAGPAWWDVDRSLRSRLVAVAALAVAVAVGAVVAVGFLAVRRELNGAVETQLRRQTVDLQRQALLARNNPFGIRLRVGVGDVGGYVQVIRNGGEVRRPDDQLVALPVARADLDVAAGGRTEVLRDVRAGGASMRMLTSRLLPDYAVQVALPRATVQTQLRRVAVSFLLLTLAGLGLAVGLAFAVSRTALAPVSALTGAAERIAATRDLTLRISETRRDELGRLAASFNTMLRALEQSVGAQRQLVADASHELRTPLASLRTNVEVLQRHDDLPDDVREEVLTAIVGQVEELTALVSDVVELARSDEPVEALEPVAYDDVVHRAAERARRNWPAATFDVATVPVTVRGVARRIDRAVTNLLDNAAKFSGGQAVVEVRLTADGVLAVRDHGPGVPEEAVPYVFDRFYRADEARALPGSGLGLAIVKQTAEAYGGRVALRNADGGGAVVTLALPPVAPPPGHAGAPAP